MAKIDLTQDQIRGLRQIFAQVGVEGGLLGTLCAEDKGKGGTGDGVAEGVAGADVGVGDVGGSGKKGCVGESGDAVGGVERGVGVRKGSQGSDFSSWSDMVEEEGRACYGELGDDRQGESAVVMPGQRELSPGVKAVKFGGTADVVGVAASVSSGENFFRDYVRNDRVKAVVRLLSDVMGCKIPKAAMVEMALATYSLATVPMAFVGGQARLRALSAVGDSAMASLLVDTMYARGEQVASVQAVKGQQLSNSVLSRALIGTGLVRHVVVPAGVDIGTAKVGADIVEAIAGVIHLYRGAAALLEYMRWLHLL